VILGRFVFAASAPKRNALLIFELLREFFPA
jgi:hypothetical protein